jgi:group II intron reverse transcriptase/maturase
MGGTAMLTGLSRIGQLVEANPDRKQRALMHYVNKETLKEEHKRQETGKASGIDKVTKTAYDKELDRNLEELVRQMKQFSYRPQPVKRVYIEKEGKTELRPLGIPSYQDKLVQGVMSEILTIIYEPKFYEFSYGYREGSSCHAAIKALDEILTGKTSFVVDADIKGFFDNVNHDWMMKFLSHDIDDKNFLRYIKRFLNTGIMENGKYTDTESGVPQGGVISPILSNVYLHYALDIWFAKRVKKTSKGLAEMVRYADDIVFCFQYESDAKTFYEALKVRLAKFGLELSEEKSKLIKFGRFAGEASGKFDFLGFTVIAGKTRGGKYTPKYKTSEKKLKVKRAKAKRWIEENIHLPIGDLVKKTNLRLQGHYNYYGISHNSDKIHNFYEYVKWQIKRGRNRRSQKDKTTWQKLDELLTQFPLAKPRIKVPLW